MTITLWSELADGARYARADKRAMRYEAEQQRATLDDPQSAHMLPRLGFELRHNTTYGRDVTLHQTWQRDYQWSYFLRQLADEVAKLITTAANSDGTVTQTI